VTDLKAAHRVTEEPARQSRATLPRHTKHSCFFPHNFLHPLAKGSVLPYEHLEKHSPRKGTGMAMLMSQSDAENLPTSGTKAAAYPTISRSGDRVGGGANEIELILRIKSGDSAAFYDLVRPYERVMYLTAMSLVRSEADAEDVAQEAVLKAFKNLARFRQESKFSTWLIQITINEAKMKLRKDRRHLYESVDETRCSEEGDYIPKDFADWREIPSQALEQKQLRKALTKALGSLAEKYRTVLILRDIQHLSISETAQALGISEANVKTRLSRARLQMRDALAPGFDGAWSRGRTYEKVRPF
jgi:RNA polymerase sigma-70 factor, ECF subfamily